MSSILHSGRRGTTSVWLLVAGGALAAATWIGGQHEIAVGLLVLYAVCAVGAYVLAGRDSDAGAALRAGGDERQRRIDRDATAVAGAAMILVAIVGAIVSSARDDGNVVIYAGFAAVGGLAYAVAFGVLSRRS
ncbi:MAG: hypothetical protein U0R68_06325 [Candidatus Nanopelagicales bacterium]